MLTASIRKNVPPSLVAALLISLAALASGCRATVGPNDGERLSGPAVSLGEGGVSTFSTIGADNRPLALGLAFSAKSLSTLPAEHSDGHRCFDADGNGTIDLQTECAMWHERAIPLPTSVSARSDVPFKWVLLNWNPLGHIPPGVYDQPHFDVHFYMEAIENVFALERGPCGPEFLRCDQFAEAIKPVPSNYLPSDFVNVKAASPAMGNHFIDTSGPEFQGKPFTRAWIYGSYAGRITFYEEMLTRAYLMSKPNRCEPIKAPAAVAVGGYYPRASCIRYDAASDAYTVSIEDFVLRRAEPPVEQEAAAKAATDSR